MVAAGIPRGFYGVALLLLSGLLASCGADDPAGAPPPERPPAPLAADLPDSFAFATNAPLAREARTMAASQLASVALETEWARTTLADLAWLDLSPGADGCWTAGGGDVTYHGCPDPGGWTWTVQTGSTVVATGTTSADAGQGAFQRFDELGDVLAAWTWAATASRDTVEWTLGQDETPDATLHWSRDGAGARLWILAWPRTLQIAFRVSASGTTGWLEVSSWSSPAETWVLREEIAWTGGRGRWVSYDDTGRETDRRRW